MGPAGEKSDAKDRTNDAHDDEDDARGRQGEVGACAGASGSGSGRLNSAGPQSDPLVARQRRSPRAPGGVIECGWCGTSTPIPARGRVPKWCSSSCRHRAWEQRRADASGLCAVDVVEREIETVTVKTVIKPVPFTVHVERRPQSATEFA